VGTDIFKEVGTNEILLFVFDLVCLWNCAII